MIFVKVCLLFFLFSLPGALLHGAPVQVQALRSSPEKCRAALQDKNTDPVIRRMAFRLLLDEKNVPEKLLLQSLSDTDPVIRRRALYELYTAKGAAAYPHLMAAVADKDHAVAELLLRCAIAFPEKTKRETLLKAIARQSRVLKVRREAVRIADFPFYRENRRLSDNPAYDHDLHKIKSIPLPLKGWSFLLDPLSDGHRKSFYKPDFNDSSWKKIDIGFWEKQGYKYNGIAWYRIRFKAPEMLKCSAVELCFGGVDETAWVWLNGTFIGQHDIGLQGWNKTFYLDVTKELLWDKENVLVVRVEDTINAGGIWKPVSLEIWK